MTSVEQRRFEITDLERLTRDELVALSREFDIELSEELGYLGCRDLPTRNTPFICPSGLSFCVIMPDGHVLPCQVVYDNAYSEGNVRDRSFADIWEHGFQRFRKVELEGDCTSCRHRNACGGGCWARLANDSGSCLRGVWDPEHYGAERVQPSGPVVVDPGVGAPQPERQQPCPLPQPSAHM